MSGVQQMMLGGSGGFTVTGPTMVTGSANTPSAGGNCTATTSAATITATGGGSFTYSWAFVSGTNATCNSPAAATTTFTRTGGAGSTSGLPTNTRDGIFRCTVTQSGGASQTWDVTVRTLHTYTGP